MLTKNKYYAVRVGRRPGIYKTWAECQMETKGIKGAIFKSFNTYEEANKFLKNESLLPLENIKCGIFVDGSYADGRYSWGMAVYRFGKLIHTGNGIGDIEELAVHRNIAGEILGAINAVLWADAANEEKVTIFYDYQGLSEWAEGRWKANTKLTKEYAAFMNKYRGRISFQKVLAHSNIEGNEVADKMAKKALQIER